MVGTLRRIGQRAGLLGTAAAKKTARAARTSAGRKVIAIAGTAALALLPLNLTPKAYHYFTRQTFGAKPIDFRQLDRAPIKYTLQDPELVEKVAAKNKQAPPEKIFFYDIRSSAIQEIDLRYRGLDQLENLNKILVPSQQERLERIVAQRVAAIANTTTTNPTIQKLIVLKYLLSLSAQERANVFSKAEQEAMRTIVEETPPERLQQLMDQVWNYRQEEAAWAANRRAKNVAGTGVTAIGTGLVAFLGAWALWKWANKRRSRY